MPDPAVTVWYDGACPLCRREIALMRRLDRGQRIRFVDAQGPTVSCPSTRAAPLARFHALDHASGASEPVSGAAAFAAMWRAIPLLRPLGLAAQWPPFLALLENAYLVFLRLRPHLVAVGRKVLR